MATFEEHIEGLTGVAIGSSGTNPTQGELSLFLQDGVKEVVNRIVQTNPTELAKFTSSTEDTNDSGVTLVGKVLSVVREHDSVTILRRCTLIDPGHRYEAADSTSLKYRSKYNPGYYVKDGKIHTVPASAGSDNSSWVTQMAYDTGLAFGDTYNASAIDNFPDEYEYLVALYAAAKTLLNTMSAKTDSLPNDIVIEVVQLIDESLPTFTTPNDFILPPLPPGVDIDFSNVATIIPFAPPELSLDAFPTITDLSISSIAPTRPTFSANTVSETNITNPTFTAAVMNPLDWNDTNNWITSEEDSEMLGARIQEISVKVQEYQARMQESLAVFNKENAILQKDLQVAIENVNNAQADDNKELQVYSNQMQQYQADVNKEVQEYQQNLNADIQAWQTEMGTKIQKYNADLQNETAKVSASVQNFQAEVQKAIQKYQTETGYDMQRYSSEVQANGQKFQTELTKNQADFTTSLQKYTSEIQKVASENQSKLAKNSAEIQNYSVKLQKHNQDYQWLQSRYVALKEEYNAAFVLMRPPAPPASPQQQVRR
tara:strand:- start:546 stop:2174 length:1629 start_codon:yes stop_codon:yes gene_type:complete